MPIVAIVLLVGLIALFRFVQRYDPSRTAAPGPLPEVSIRLTGAVLVERHAGKPRWSVHADRIDVLPLVYGNLERFRSAEFVGIRGGNLYRDGKREASFSADQATYDEGTQRFDIRGNLRFRALNGDRLDAPECIWSDREDTVRMPKGASASFGGNIATTPYLLYQPRKRRAQCPQGAAGTFDHYPLRAGAVDWDVAGESVHCTGSVAGERRSFSYDAQEAWLDLRKHTMRANKCVVRLRIGSEDEFPEGLQ